ncbi:MAG: uracil-DNA glycosylase [bacterium]|nr:uracil-DNA glycosylase [bacterium]MDY2830042.1 uracil-DNA glycosylase [Alphaproteobacteria bacterium]
MTFCPPDKNCALCPRLLAFRAENIKKFPAYYNAPVPPFGDLSAQVLIIGLAPGINGANKTGRPFTNDYAGDVLYPILKKHGFAAGTYGKTADDGFKLLNVRITNSVRCVPPQNKVTGDEVKACGTYLTREIAAMPNLKVILTLGSVAHNALLGVLGYKKSAFKFAHGAIHRLPEHNLILLNSYHTSRYNINTGVLTYEMFDKIIDSLKNILTK